MQWPRSSLNSARHLGVPWPTFEYIKLLSHQGGHRVVYLRRSTHTQQTMRIELMFLLLTETLVVLARPHSQPRWHNPCQTMAETSPAPTDRNLRITCARQLQNSLSHIKYQLRLTLRHFSRQPLQDFYREASRGLDEVQYKPSWLPDSSAKVLVGNYKQVIKGLTTLHQDLQKFAMAIEAMIKDDEEEYKNVKILQEIESYMIQLLCEVEAALISLGCERPYAVQRSIMPEEDRHPPEETRRLVRDWGILSKYRTYLTKRRQELLTVIRERRKH